MRFFVDQNVSTAIVPALRVTYLGHEFDHAYDEGLSAVDDIPLFEVLGRRQYDAIITRDRNQLSNDDERRALHAAGLHWIGHKAKGHPGLHGIAMATATIVSGLYFVLDDLRDKPHVYLLKGVESQVGQRVTISAVELAKWNA